MARYLPNDADTLNPCTLPPRVRCEPKLVVGPPRWRFGLGKEILRGKGAYGAAVAEDSWAMAFRS
jgi:hypothetical protein